MKKIAIRADGNSVIGFGHLVRTQALAHQLEKLGAELIFFSRNPENVNGFQVVALGSGDLENEDQAVIAYLSEYGIDMLIIDSYAYDQGRLDRMGKLAIASVYIDDMNRYLFNTSFIVNGNLYAPRLDYRGQAKFLLGSDYLMMREDFSGLAARSVQPEVENVLLTLGAADMENITPALIKILFTYTRFESLRWHIVIGPAFSNHEEIACLVRDRSNLFICCSPIMKDLMGICDLAISAAGSTSYELAACGVPGILLVAADNQVMLAAEMERQQIAINLGWHHQLDREVLYAALDKLIDDNIARQRMVSRGQAVIDGRGAARLAKLLINHTGGNCG